MIKIVLYIIAGLDILTNFAYIIGRTFETTPPNPMVGLYFSVAIIMLGIAQILDNQERRR